MNSDMNNHCDLRKRESMSTYCHYLLAMYFFYFVMTTFYKLTIVEGKEILLSN